MVARIAASEGLGGAARGELAAFGDSGERVGRCSPACSMRRSSASPRSCAGTPSVSLIVAAIGRDSAQRAGLACGGRRALVQRLDAIPEAFWSTSPVASRRRS